MTRRRPEMGRNRFLVRRPRLETLEDRACPAGGAHLSGGTLHIDGDADGNHINLLVMESGEISVEYDGVSSLFDEPIDHIVVRSGGGADLFFAELYPVED